MRTIRTIISLCFTSSLFLAAPAGAVTEGVPSLLAWGMSLQDEGKPEVAEVGFDAAIGRAPTWSLPFIERGELAIARREGVAEARADLARFEARNSQNPRLHRVMGELAEISGDDAVAERYFGKAVELRPDPNVRARRAAALVRIERFADAATEYALVLEELPDDHAVRSRYADALESAGRHKEARGQIDLLIRRQPGKEAPLRQLARFLERRGDRKGAANANARADKLGGSERNLRPLPPSRN